MAEDLRATIVAALGGNEDRPASDVGPASDGHLSARLLCVGEIADRIVAAVSAEASQAKPPAGNLCPDCGHSLDEDHDADPEVGCLHGWDLAEAVTGGRRGCECNRAGGVW